MRLHPPVLALASLTLPLLACAGCGRPGMTVTVGQPFDEARARLVTLGAEAVPCSYDFGTMTAFLILPTGHTVWLEPMQDAEDQLFVGTLRISNSTALFCCKGECWYDIGCPATMVGLGCEAPC